MRINSIYLVHQECRQLLRAIVDELQIPMAFLIGIPRRPIQEDGVSRDRTDPTIGEVIVFDGVDIGPSDTDWLRASLGMGHKVDLQLICGVVLEIIGIEIESGKMEDIGESEPD